MMKNSIYGCVTVEFTTGELQEVKTFQVSATDRQTWKLFVDDPDRLLDELDLFHDEFAPAFRSVYEGDILNLQCDGLDAEYWDEAMQVWVEFFQSNGFACTAVESLGRVRDHLTPDEQIRADTFEDFMDSIRRR